MHNPPACHPASPEWKEHQPVGRGTGAVGALNSRTDCDRRVCIVFLA